MDSKRITMVSCACLTTLDEIGSGPESSFYMALGCNLDEWYNVKCFMLHMKYVECRDNWLHLTDAGREIAKRVSHLFK